MKTILITGAASGLGWALSQQAFALGHRVIMTDMNALQLGARADALAKEDPSRVSFHRLDVTDSEAITRLVALLKEKEAGLDVLINNAGITHRSLADKTDLAVFRKVMAVDWQAPVEMAVACLPLLKRSGGGIINIGSMAGWMPVLTEDGEEETGGSLVVSPGHVTEQMLEFLLEHAVRPQIALVRRRALSNAV